MRPTKQPLYLVYSPHYEMDLGNHIFPVTKYRRIVETLQSDPEIGPSLVIVEPDPVSREDLLLIHTPEYVDKVENGRLTPDEILTMEIPWSPAIVSSMKRICGGTLKATRLALEHRAGIHVGGGFHHAFPDHGEGFCMFNDVAIAIRKGQQMGWFHKVLVIDLDVHHGNGTAYIFREDPNVFTFSIHQERNYPAVKPPSNLDIGLPDKADDTTYLKALAHGLDTVNRTFHPDFVYYLAGADPFIYDQLGGLSLTMEGFREREAMVYSWVKSQGCPLVITLAGGYAINPEDTVAIHVQTIRMAFSFFYMDKPHRIASDMEKESQP